jgi:hypothetical protein
MIYVGLLCCALAALSACKKDSITQSNLRVVMTDSPVDDARVKAVYITVAEVRIDGVPLEGFSKTTFDISAYQKGATRLLAEVKLKADTYRDITLVLDYGTAANGQAPGCWVEEINGAKQALQSSSAQLHLTRNFTLSNSTMTTLVLDFDLRKAIRRDPAQAGRYAFVNHAALQSALRANVASQTGAAKGHCTNQITASDVIVVYAYQKGTYNALLERSEVGGIAFVNAVNSAAVDEQGHFEMHFLPPGEYELVFIAYKDLNGNGDLNMQGTLLMNVLTGQDLKSVPVAAESTSNIQVQVTGLIPI